MERVIAYIDGFNLYYGLKSKNWKRYLWLDIPSLASSLLRPTQRLVATKYFTARISAPPNRVRRQGVFIDALNARGKIAVFEGKFQPKKGECRRCGHTWRTHEEKQTDVNVAVEMMKDAYLDEFDMALLISADSDLTPPVVAVETLHPGKRVVVASPPGRHSDVLAGAASANIRIGRRKIAQCQLPPEVAAPSGHLLQRPKEWC